MSGKLKDNLKKIASSQITKQKIIKKESLGLIKSVVSKESYTASSETLKTDIRSMKDKVQKVPTAKDIKENSIIHKCEKLKKKENIYTNDQIEEHAVLGINHRRNVSIEHRSKKSISNLVTNIVDDSKDFRDFTEIRENDPELYVKRVAECNDYFLDPYKPENAQMRGQHFHMLNMIDSQGSKIYPDIDVTPLEIALESREIQVEYHSSFNQPSDRLMLKSFELLSVDQISKLLGKSCYALGDQSLDDPEVKRFLKDRKVICPDENNKQQRFDMLIVEPEENKQEEIRLGDLKVRSANHAISNAVVERDINSTTYEFYSYGAVSPANQKIIHKTSAEFAIIKCDKELARAETQEQKEKIEIKKKEALEYLKSGDISVLKNSQYIGIPIFNQFIED